MKKEVKLAIKINFYILALIFAYQLLQIVILKGRLFVIENILISLFYLNCVLVGLKLIFRK